MDRATYLIVDQQQPPPEKLPGLLKELAQNYQLDIYQCRQRLIGCGLSLLTKGPAKKLRGISTNLKQAGFTHWLVEPSKPEFVPSRIRALQLSPDKIVFICRENPVTFPRGANILAVLAEMSGELVEKSIKQLLSSNAYRGRDHIRPLEQRKIQRIILQGQPILDLYRLNEQQRIVAAVRAFPGKFNPEGLGERATLSSRQNLDRVLKLVQEYAGHCTLVTDFGLVNLPGCVLRRGNPDDLETQRHNQLSLARYGWLLADLERAGPIRPSVTENTAELTATATAALLQNPTTATGQSDDILPLTEKFGTELNEAANYNNKTQSPEPGITESFLPAPPASRKTYGWNRLNFWIGSAAALAFAGFTLRQGIDHKEVIGAIAYHAFASGAIFFLPAALLLWPGFYFIRLKRQVENTPTSKVRSIAMGMVEVKGRALRQYALLSPMSNIPCVFYRLTKYRRDRNNQWRVAGTSSSDDVPFLLEDDTGRVEVDPAGCRVSARTRQEGVPGQVGLTRFCDDSDEKWVEEIIVEGTLLYVLGFAAVKRETGPTLTERKIEALRELKHNPQDIREFDADGDGRISQDEWDRARAAVEEKILCDELRKNQQRKKQEEQVVIGRKRGRPLVIAETRSEDRLTKRYAFYSITLFAIAGSAIGWGIHNLLDYLK